jgi:hypothetical protein
MFHDTMTPPPGRGAGLTTMRGGSAAALGSGRRDDEVGGRTTYVI